MSCILARYRSDLMKLNHARSLLLGTTILLPGLLFAQVDPTASPATQTQPGRPQQPTHPSQQDSGPNHAAVGPVMQDKIFLRKAAQEGIPESKLAHLAAHTE